MNDIRSKLVLVQLQCFNTTHMSMRNRFNCPYCLQLGTCRHVAREVTTTCYHNPKSNYKKGVKWGPRNSEPNDDLDVKAAIRYLFGRIAAVGLGLGFLG